MGCSGMSTRLIWRAVEPRASATPSHSSDRCLRGGPGKLLDSWDPSADPPGMEGGLARCVPWVTCLQQVQGMCLCLRPPLTPLTPLLPQRPSLGSHTPSTTDPIPLAGTSRLCGRGGRGCFLGKHHPEPTAKKHGRGDPRPSPRCAAPEEPPGCRPGLCAPMAPVLSSSPSRLRPHAVTCHPGHHVPPARGLSPQRRLHDWVGVPVTEPVHPVLSKTRGRGHALGTPPSGGSDQDPEGGVGRGAMCLRVKASAGHHYPGWGRGDAVGGNERGATWGSAAPHTVIRAREN